MISWLHSYHDAGPRFDAAVADSIDAHHRSGDAAQGVTGAAREARHRVESARRSIRTHSSEERDRSMRTSDIRSLVEDMLESLDKPKDNKGRGS